MLSAVGPSRPVLAHAPRACKACRDENSGVVWASDVPLRAKAPSRGRLPRRRRRQLGPTAPAALATADVALSRGVSPSTPTSTIYDEDVSHHDAPFLGARWGGWGPGLRDAEEAS